MNLTDYTYLLNKPDAINERYAESLEKVMEEFPYFQSARVMRLKHLYNQDSYKYNQALKVSAAYTTDRSMLFDFITSDDFVAVQKGLYERKLQELLNIHVVESEIVVVNKSQSTANPLEQSILSSIQQSNPEESLAIEKLEIGKPLEFSKDEKHSFEEWLQLARFTPIIREEKKETNTQPFSEEKKKKLDLIDKFIESNPKIPAIDREKTIPVKESKDEDISYLMTETLARVYLEQKKYSKAIQAYEILILKYPEKSSFFADRISDIKILQQNNN
ncbi:tetratricopeptide repeat protein [Flavobacterium capsici]|uniref:Tetratricopeptide repeat protein n=1 Tax=Flavobacterium capsici TaxID=3075618 RepID=A0AA96J3B9_9FLAO|nr:MULTISPECIES: tetratricopeptide repeat protein [unclassified Flavobacterium]WNM19153.1 tetratricopeptide repeat protein [Flavobacterium sp. PMR2A8]WNM20542.1 tetratricopeptide repeat protein [Flavobacterium sp. PMTSA4]